MIVPIVIGALGGGTKEVLCDVANMVFSERLRAQIAEIALAEMQITLFINRQ